MNGRRLHFLHGPATAAPPHAPRRRSRTSPRKSAMAVGTMRSSKSKSGWWQTGRPPRSPRADEEVRARAPPAHSTRSPRPRPSAALGAEPRSGPTTAPATRCTAAAQLGVVHHDRIAGLESRCRRHPEARGRAPRRPRGRARARARCTAASKVRIVPASTARRRESRCAVSPAANRQTLTTAPPS